jgi:hypothetical protein
LIVDLAHLTRFSQVHQCKVAALYYSRASLPQHHLLGFSMKSYSKYFNIIREKELQKNNIFEHYRNTTDETSLTMSVVSKLHAEEHEKL